MPDSWIVNCLDYAIHTDDVVTHLIGVIPQHKEDLNGLKKISLLFNWRLIAGGNKFRARRCWTEISKDGRSDHLDRRLSDNNKAEQAAGSHLLALLKPARLCSSPSLQLDSFEREAAESDAHWKLFRLSKQVSYIPAWCNMKSELFFFF